ncbi:MAG: DUF2207 domain-containing protein, partial [Bacteroidota bacterium]
MKISSILLWLSCLLFSLTLSAQQERILNYEVDLVVNTDRSIVVTELIEVYVAGQQIKRGITRSFPQERDLNGRTVSTKYELLHIKKNGAEEPYLREEQGGDLMLYIGQREVLLEPGEYSYEIKYRVPNQIGFYDDYDEIYWNAVGTDVRFPVEKASCRVHIPEGASIIQQAAYTGGYSSVGDNYTTRFEDGVVNFEITESLLPREGFTVAVGFQKDMVTAPGFFDRFGTLVIIVIGLLLLLPYYFLTWFRYGQDPATPASYPLFESPDDLSPASINYILKEGYQNKSFTASVVSLAI